MPEVVIVCENAPGGAPRRRSLPSQQLFTLSLSPEHFVGNEPTDGNGMLPLLERLLLDDGLERGTQFVHAAVCRDVHSR